VLSVTIYRCRSTSNIRRSIGDRLRAFWKVGGQRILVLPVSPQPEVVF